VLTSLDAAAVHRWCEAGLAALRKHQQEIDDLNVYPVPDGDTGTNLVLTFTSAYEALAAELEQLDDQAAPGTPRTEQEVTRLGRVLRCMARGALLGARGNSGVILSQLLRGLADALAAHPEARGHEVTAALVRAADAGYAAVAEPVEGTVLSVARGAAEAAQRAHSDDLVVVCTAAAHGAADALDRTPSQLEALARAGVVDAGGRGLVVLLDALVGVVTGAAPATTPLARMARDPGLLLVERETGSAEYAYEVQYLLDADDAAVDRLRKALGGLGDSLVVVGTGDGTWNVHVHVNDVGGAIEAGVEAGRPHRISVTRFVDQTSGRTMGEPRPSAGPPIDPDARAIVVVAQGVGIAALLEREGALVVSGGAGRSPSTAEILAAIRSTGAGEVVVLPNDANLLGVADAAAAEARGEDRTVAVIPTRSIVQALAALAVRDADRRFGDDVIAMAEAAGATRWAEVTVASRDALTVAGRCRAGDVIALVEGEVVLVAPGTPDGDVHPLTAASAELLDRLLATGGELVTVLAGEQAPEDVCAVLQDHIAARWPHLEVQCLDGGQPNPPLLLGVE